MKVRPIVVVLAVGLLVLAPPVGAQEKATGAKVINFDSDPVRR